MCVIDAFSSIQYYINKDSQNITFILINQSNLQLAPDFLSSQTEPYSSIHFSYLSKRTAYAVALVVFNAVIMSS